MYSCCHVVLFYEKKYYSTKIQQKSRRHLYSLLDMALREGKLHDAQLTELEFTN